MNNDHAISEEKYIAVVITDEQWWLYRWWSTDFWMNISSAPDKYDEVFYLRENNFFPTLIYIIVGWEYRSSLFARFISAEKRKLANNWCVNVELIYSDLIVANKAWNFRGAPLNKVGSCPYIGLTATNNGTYFLSGWGGSEKRVKSHHFINGIQAL